MRFIKRGLTAIGMGFVLGVAGWRSAEQWGTGIAFWLVGGVVLGVAVWLDWEWRRWGARRALAKGAAPHTHVGYPHMHQEARAVPVIPGAWVPAGATALAAAALFTLAAQPGAGPGAPGWLPVLSIAPAGAGVVALVAALVGVVLLALGVVPAFARAAGPLVAGPVALFVEMGLFAALLIGWLAASGALYAMPDRGPVLWAVSLAATLLLAVRLGFALRVAQVRRRVPQGAPGL